MHPSSPLAFFDLWNWLEQSHVPAHKTPHNNYLFPVNIMLGMHHHIFVKLYQCLAFYLSRHLRFILAIRPVIKIFLLVKLWDVNQVWGLENAVAGNSPKTGFYGFKILTWWESDDQKSWSQKQIPLFPSSWLAGIGVSVCIHTCRYTLYTHGYSYCIQIIFRGSG